MVTITEEERKLLLKTVKEYSAEWNVGMLTKSMIENVFIDGYKYAKSKQMIDNLYTEKEVIDLTKEAVGLWRPYENKTLYRGRVYFGRWIKRKIKERQLKFNKKIK